jgi:hypothetical protein
MVILV